MRSCNDSRDKEAVHSYHEHRGERAQDETKRDGSHHLHEDDEHIFTRHDGGDVAAGGAGGQANAPTCMTI